MPLVVYQLNQLFTKMCSTFNKHIDYIIVCQIINSIKYFCVVEMSCSVSQKLTTSI